jgi:hypothetical protein
MNATPSMGPAPAAQENPLLAHADPTKWSEGTGLIGDVADTVSSAIDGNWAEGLLNGVGAAAGLGSFLTDPLAGLASAGVGWLMEHVSFLTEPLDWLTGDQTTLEEMSGTWGNISNHLEQVSTDLKDWVKSDSGRWTGRDVSAYAGFGADRADTYGAVGMAAQGISVLINICKTIMNVVRGIVRDLISEAIGKLISICLRWAPAVAAFGAGVAGAIAEAVPLAIKYANKALDWCKKLTKAFGNAMGIFKKLEGALTRAQDNLSKSGKGFVDVLTASKAADRARIDVVKGGDFAFGKMAGEAYGAAKKVVVDGMTGLPKDIGPKIWKDLKKEGAKVLDHEWQDWRQVDAEKENSG